jgi:hypothetical protein
MHGTGPTPRPIGPPHPYEDPNAKSIDRGLNPEEVPIMLERQHPRHEEERHAGAGGAPGTPGQHSIGADAEPLLAAGDEAIERALSGDSTAFLRSHRQSGGQ